MARALACGSDSFFTQAFNRGELAIFWVSVISRSSSCSTRDFS